GSRAARGATWTGGGGWMTRAGRPSTQPPPPDSTSTPSATAPQPPPSPLKRSLSKRTSHYRLSSPKRGPHEQRSVRGATTRTQRPQQSAPRRLRGKPARRLEPAGPPVLAQARPLPDGLAPRRLPGTSGWRAQRNRAET